MSAHTASALLGPGLGRIIQAVRSVSNETWEGQGGSVAARLQQGRGDGLAGPGSESDVRLPADDSETCTAQTP
jgi:hypothetical protein